MVDPNDKKPEDWDDRRQVPDENATMPEGWQEDEPALVPDPNASVSHHSAALHIAGQPTATFLCWRGFLPLLLYCVLLLCYVHA